MIKLLIKHKLIELTINNIFNGLITNFTPVPVMNGIMEIDEYGINRWWLNGELHRVDGPAIEYANGGKRWWLNDVEYTEKDYWKQLK